MNHVFKVDLLFTKSKDGDGHPAKQQSDKQQDFLHIDHGRTTFKLLLKFGELQKA